MNKKTRFLYRFRRHMFKNSLSLNIRPEDLLMSSLNPLETLDPARFDTPTILKKLAGASRKLAELKGITQRLRPQLFAGRRDHRQAHTA